MFARLRARRAIASAGAHAYPRDASFGAAALCHLSLARGAGRITWAVLWASLCGMPAQAHDLPLEPGSRACVGLEAAASAARWPDKFRDIGRACALEAGPARPQPAPESPRAERPGWSAPIELHAPQASADAPPPAPDASAPPTPRGNTAGARAVALAPLIDATARRHDIDPLLLHAIAYVESRHRSDALSPAGAVGLMQVMPGTAGRFGVRDARHLRHAATSLEVSAGYLKWLQRRFSNRLHLVVAAYNAGEGAVERYGHRVPPYPETQAYVRSVLSEYERLRSAAAAQAASLSSPKGIL